MQTYTAIALLSLLGITLSANATPAFETQLPKLETATAEYMLSAQTQQRARALLGGAPDAGILPSLMFTLIRYKISNGTGRKRFPQLTWFGPFIRAMRIFSDSSFST
jgi:hypothetical protein